MKGWSDPGIHRYAVLFVAIATAQNVRSGQAIVVSLQSSSGSPGTSVSLALTMQAANDKPAALQWRLQYSANAVTGINVTAGPTAIASGKEITCSSTAGSTKCILVGLNRSSIADGVFANIVVQLATNVAAASVPIAVVNTLAASSAGDEIAMTSTSGLISIKAQGRCQPPTFATTTNQIAFGPEGGQSSVTLNANCAWEITSSASWLYLSSGSKGTASTTVAFGVMANPTMSARYAQLTIVGGGTITVVQSANSGECSAVSIRPPVVQVPDSLTAATFGLDLGADCAWKALSTKSWLQVYPLAGKGSSAVEYTVFPNFTSQERSGTINVAGKDFTIIQAGNAETQSWRLIEKLYFNYLGRIGGRDEVQFQITEGIGKGVPPAKIVENFFRTPEFDLGGRFIAGLYVGLLNRVPEYSGWLFQRNALAAGIVNQRELVTNFLNSFEFAQKFGTLDSPAFVRLLYRQVLLREPSQDEVTFQVQALEQGAVDRVGIANAFLNSGEFREGTAPMITTVLLYATLLQRDATPSELASGTMQFASGRTVFDFTNFLVSGSEFMASLD